MTKTWANLKNARASRSGYVRQLLYRYPPISPFIVIVIACAVFAFANPRFISLGNLSLIAQQTTIIGTLAIGQTLIILTAGIDLSIGAIMILSSLVMTRLMADAGVSSLWALIAGLGVACVAAALNGALVVLVKMPPFVVTLGSLSIFTALAIEVSQGRTILLDSDAGILATGDGPMVGGFRITWGIALMIFLYICVGFALRKTKWGRHLYAAGDNVETARLAGVKTRRIVFSAYLISGIICAAAAWILIGRIGGGDPNSAIDANLQSITAVVIGGTSLFGGRGGVAGTIIGATIVIVFENGLALLGVGAAFQIMAIGILVIAAVALDVWIRGKVRK